LEGLGQFGFREVTLSPLEVLSVAYVSVSEFIRHVVYAIDACVLTHCHHCSWYDILFAEDESDAGVGSGRRRRFLYWHGFRFSTTWWNVFV